MSIKSFGIGNFMEISLREHRNSALGFIKSDGRRCYIADDAWTSLVNNKIRS